jgi:hypothetical protein
MTGLVYDLTFIGLASDTLTHEFDGCTLSHSNGTTTVRCAVTDQDALHTLIDRIYRFDRDLVAIRKVSE